MLSLLFSEYRPYIQDGLAVAVCVAAFLWGRGPEKIIAVTWFILFKIVAVIYLEVFRTLPDLEEIDLGLAAIDLCAVLIFVAVALNANRNYPLWIAAMQVLVMIAHVARGMIEVISPLSYATMVVAPSWIQLAVLGAGIFRHRRREKAFGPYREWRVPVRFGGLLAKTDGHV